MFKLLHAVSVLLLSMNEFVYCQLDSNVEFSNIDALIEKIKEKRKHRVFNDEVNLGEYQPKLSDQSRYRYSINVILIM